jgi:nicotinate-nucleotide adenylyltransferase
VALARTARDTLVLDELRWMPAGAPWQKPAGELAPAGHRLAMVRLLVGDEPGFVVDERELHRHGPSYTVDSLGELRREQPGAELVLVIGQDQYARVDTWRDAAQWRPWVTFAVAARDGQPPRPPTGWDAGTHRMVPLPLPELPISATRIRQRVRAGEDITSLVGPDVARYIDQHRLYRA